MILACCYVLSDEQAKKRENWLGVHFDFDSLEEDVFAGNWVWLLGEG